MHRGPFHLSPTERPLVESLMVKVFEPKPADPKTTLISYNQVKKLLAPAELELIDRVMQTDPVLYGFTGPYQGIEEPSSDLVAAEGQQYRFGDQVEAIAAQYLPPRTFKDYSKLKAAIKRDIDSDLLIGSSYRSPVYQALTFLNLLKLYDFDVRRTARRCAIPGFSEHGTLSRLALDFINQDGIPTHAKPLDFQHTREYAWLLDHAGGYHFYLSYPKDNQLGVMFEPWHWRHSAG